MKAREILMGLALGLIMTSCGKKPVADFTWEPKEPKAGQEVKFTNLQLTQSLIHGTLEICLLVTKPILPIFIKEKEIILLI